MWHVRDVKIYEHPVEVQRFFLPTERGGEWRYRVSKAPQSWCYIERVVRGTFASAAGGRGSEQKGCGLLLGEADNCNACLRQALRPSQEGEGAKESDARCGNGNREVV